MFLQIFFEETGFELFLGKAAFDGRHFEDGAQDSGQQTVAEKHAVVEDEILEVPALGRHDHGAMRGVQGGDGPLRTGDQFHGSMRASPGAYPAAEAQLRVEVDAAGTVRFLTGFRASTGQSSAQRPHCTHRALSICMMKFE